MNEPPPPPPVPPPRRHAPSPVTTSPPSIPVISVSSSVPQTVAVPLPISILPPIVSQAPLPTPVTVSEAPLQTPTPPLTTPSQVPMSTPATTPTTISEAPVQTPTPPTTLPAAPLPANIIPTPTLDISPTSLAIALACSSFASTTIALATLPTTSITLPSTSPKPPQRRKNLNGFEDGNWYKIRNVGDNSVVQLEAGNKFICMEENDEKLDLQLFKSSLQANGTFRIMAKLQHSPDIIHVWDYLNHRGLLLQRKQSPIDKINQNWKSEPVPGFHSLYLIQSGKDSESQLCLKNTGLGKQIQLIAKDKKTLEDNFTHWYLEIQE